MGDKLHIELILSKCKVLITNLCRIYLNTYKSDLDIWIYIETRKPVVTGRKVILFLSIFGSQFLSHQKISVTTKDTAEFNVKHVQHNVITTKSIKMALANRCTCLAILVPMVTMQPFAFNLICTWAVVQTIIYRNNSLNYNID